MTNFEGIEFEENPDPRAPLLLVLDCSASMETLTGETGKTALQELNDGLDVLITEVQTDPLAQRRAEISFLPYGTEPTQPTPFTTVDTIALPELTPLGVTSTGAALQNALNHLEERKQTYRQNGITYYQPMLFLISDGAATDNVTEVSNRIKELEETKKLSFFPIGVAGANMNELSNIGTRKALPLQGTRFSELFKWISQSVAAVSASNPGDQVNLSRDGLDDWLAL